MSTHPLTVGPSRPRQIEVLCEYIAKLPAGKAFTVEIKEYRRKRSTDQNRYLWGVVYSAIIDSCDDPKPSADALHEYWLGECFGWDVSDTLGWVQKKPMRRSSSLNTEEFGQFWVFIQRRCAETRGIVIPDPDPQWKFHNEVDS
jgi:hypothetical protein